MPDWLQTLANSLQDSVVGDAVRGTPYLYATLESIHILGIVVLVGPAFAFDLRLLGAGRRAVPVTAAARCLLPISHVGLVIALLTGVALISAQTTTVVGSAAAPWKLGLLLVAGLNVLVFHRGVYGRVEQWAEDRVTPLAARVAAGVSMTTWTGVVFAGRFLAYV